MILYSYVYILSNNRNAVLYTGITSDLLKRMSQHKSKLIEGFTKKYNVDKLVYYLQYEDINEAIKKEKQIKAGSRKMKESLITKANPEWKDLYSELL